MNKKLVESLVKSGACDDFGTNRAELLTQIDGALAQANANARDRDAGQSSLLDLLGPMEPVTKGKRAPQSSKAAFPISRGVTGSITRRSCSAFT